MPEVNLVHSDFRQAEAILQDLAHSETFDFTREEEIAASKIFQARKNNQEFELELAVRISGDREPYPYRSSYFLTKFFTDLGYNYTHHGETRRFWVRDVLNELSVNDIAYLIQYGLFRRRAFYDPATEAIDTQSLHDALQDFKKFINESLQPKPAISLTDILDLNINVELLFEHEADTPDQALNELIEEAKQRFLNQDDRQTALEKLWDAFERLKTYFHQEKGGKRDSANHLINLSADGFDEDILDREFRTLTAVGNEYRIRHHETNKKEIENRRHLNYLFFRMLNLLDLCLISIKETSQE